MAAAVVVPLGTAPALRHHLPGALDVIVRDDVAVALVRSVSEAVRAALEVTAGGEVSVGVALGEIDGGAAAEGDDGLASGPLSEAVALYGQARAVPGSVWVTAAVAGLARRTGAVTRPVGPVTVGPGWIVEAVELVVAPAATGRVPLPAPLAASPPFPFVARPSEDALLEAAWAEAATGRRGVVLLAGEAGVGKSRLGAELARRAHEHGAIVLYGSCREDIAVPYQPLVEALDHLVAHEPSLVAAVDSQAAELGRLLPRLRALAVAPSTGDPDSDRYRLFGAITALLAEAGRSAPVLVVMEDIHWAAAATLQLLAHLLRATSPMPLLVIATYRDTPAEVGAALREALPELHRLGGVAAITVHGLDAAGVRSFVVAAAGHDVDAALAPVVDHLLAQTDGNPFLLGELWRHVVEVGCLERREGRWRVARPLAGADSPEGVRQVIAARLARLEPAVADVLAVAAVIGPAFDLGLVAAAAGEPAARVAGRLDVAASHGVVEPDGPGRHRFAHALVRASVYDRLAPARRAAVHSSVVHALAGRPDASPGEVAHHAARAVPFIDAAVAVEHARRGAAAATRAGAHDEAVDLLAAVLPLTGRNPRRAELLLELSGAAVRRGDVTHGQQAALEAATLAHELGEGSVLIRAALAYEEASWRTGAPSPTGEQLLQLALAEAPPGLSPEAVALRAALSRTLSFLGRAAEAETVGRRAVHDARRLGDTASLALALQAQLFGLWPPDAIDRGVEQAEELAVLARRLGDLDVELRAATWRLYGRLSQPPRQPVLEAFREHGLLERRAGQLFYRALHLQAGATLALSDGRFADAEALAADADRVTALQRGADLSGAYGVQVFSIRREQGRLEEVRPVVELVARLERSQATWRPGLAALYAELGMLDEAGRLVVELVADDLAAIPRDSLRCGSLSLIADAITAVDDPHAAAVVYEHLLPWRGLMVQVGTYLACYGSVDRYLGRLAMTAGRWRLAAGHLDAALQADTARGSPVWLAHTQFECARLLSRRGRADDVGRAASLAAAAETTASRLGMVTLARRAAGLVSDLRTVTPTATRAAGMLTEREIDVLRRVAEGRSNREIGDVLHLSPHTVAAHLRSILVKTGCANRTEAATWGIRHGLVAG